VEEEDGCVFAGGEGRGRVEKQRMSKKGKERKKETKTERRSDARSL
jgi:hypothetical protein